MNKENSFKKILTHFTSNRSGKKTIKHETVQAVSKASGLNIKEKSAEKQINKYLLENKIQIEPDEFFTDFYVDRKENKNILSWKVTPLKGFGVVLTKTSEESEKEVFYLENANQYIDEEIKGGIKYIYELSMEKKEEACRAASIPFYDHLDKEKIKKKITSDPHNPEITDNLKPKSFFQTIEKKNNNNSTPPTACSINPSSDSEPIIDDKKSLSSINKNKGQTLMNKDRWILKIFIYLLYPWALLPILMVILGLIFSSLPFSSKFWSGFAIIASLIWIISSLLLILGPVNLTHGRKGNKKRWSNNMGLICTLTIGVPAVLFGSLSLLQYIEDFPYQPSFVESSVNIDLSSIEKTATIFILDVSDSFVTFTSNDKKKNYNAAVDIMKLIGNYDQKSDDNPLLRKSDVLIVYVFSEDYRALDKLEIKDFKSLEKDENNFFTRLKNDIKNIKSRSNAQNTDILKCLENIYEVINDFYLKKPDYSHANIIIFSDFIQSIGDKSGPRHLVEEQLWNLTTNIQKNPMISLTAFYKSDDPPLKKNEINLLPIIEKGLSRNKFKKININKFSEIPDEYKVGILSINLYKQELVNKPLYLRYKLFPWSSIPAKIIYSETLKKDRPVYVSLVKSYGKPSNVRLRLKDPDVVLSIEDSDYRPIHWSPDDNSCSCSVTLEHEITGNRSDNYKLHLAFPDRAVTKIISLVITPLLPKSVMQIVLIIIFGLLCIPGIVAYSIYREWNMLL